MMRPEVASLLLLWSVGLIVTLAAIVALLLVERVRDGRLRDRLIRAAGRDGKVIVARNEEITALKAEADGLRTQVMMQAADIDALEALVGDRQPRRPVVRQGGPDDELWRRFEADFHHPCPPGFPAREGLDGGDPS